MTEEPTIAPFGSWRSPVTAERLARGGVRLGAPQIAGGVVHWIEGRAAEAGRSVLVRQGPEGHPQDVTPDGFNVRNRVHEYGGGAYVALADGTVFFTNWDDQRLYRQDPGGAPRPLTPEPSSPMGLRYADPRVTPDGRWVICIRERHGEGEAVNEVVAVPADGSGEPAVIAGGHDFFSNPRPSPDGRRLAWLAWDHPNLPWDGTELWVGDLSAEAAVSGARRVAGDRSTSIFQPEWSPQGILYFVSEATGWWNLYRLADQDRAEPVAPRPEEFGLPQWVFDMSTYDFLADGRIVVRHGPPEATALGILDPSTGGLRDLDLGPFTMVGLFVRAEGDTVALTLAGPRDPWAVASVRASTGDVRVLRRSSDDPIDEGTVSVAEHVEFPTEGGQTAHAFLYRPANAGFRGPEGQRPPLVVLTHGGPTADVSAEYQAEVQYWTSRGFAVLDVNYGGSTGYGKAYRERLLGRWGVVDVADCVNGARWLARRGDVDGSRMAIRGGSAGGYCTLCALTFYDDFAAGASYFGIGDLETFARDTHKFESRYMDTLVGPYPEAALTYRERSPANFVERISCPMILFQGLDDRIVPPSQAEQMVEVLERKGLPYAYIPFAGEQHGFRMAENIQRAFEDELSFYGQVFGFTPADEQRPVAVRNLPRSPAPQ